ncbi:Small heat shock protein 21 [Candida viswanathii]|uniref:Small heat shock protein 21 n=1 Tax=Candida viswanathii TaxID=5486 RepID=A0A367YQC2_9ASCO|nr:Small heat shock protein 21 [Candida viswanathii]
MSWFYNVERDFDDLFHRPRRYTNKVPPNYNPRRIAGSGYSRSRPQQQRGSNNQQLSIYDPSGGSLVTTGDDFFDDFWKNFSLGKYFVGFDDNLKTEEKPDKYLVVYADDDLNEEDVSIDFNKQDNELIISISQEEEDDEGGHAAKSYYSTVKFDKPIDAAEIQADITPKGIDLVLPKEHPDDEHIVHIPVGKGKGKTGANKSSK